MKKLSSALFIIFVLVGCTNMRQNDEMLKVYNDIADMAGEWVAPDYTDYSDALDYTITFSVQLQSLDLEGVTPKFKAVVHQMSESLEPLIQSLKSGEENIDLDRYINNIAEMKDQLWAIAKENGAEWETDNEEAKINDEDSSAFANIEKSNSSNEAESNDQTGNSDDADSSELNEISEDLTIDSVKDSVLNQVDASLTISQAFDGYKYFGKTTWTTFEDKRGREYVQVDCPIELDKYVGLEFSPNPESNFGLGALQGTKLKGETVSVLSIIYENLDLLFSQQFIISHDGSSFEVGASTFSINAKPIRQTGGEPFGGERNLDKSETYDALVEIYDDEPISAIVINEEIHTIIASASKLSLEKLKANLESGKYDNEGAKTNDEESSALGKVKAALDDGNYTAAVDILMKTRMDLHEGDAYDVVIEKLADAVAYEDANATKAWQTLKQFYSKQ